MLLNTVIISLNQFLPLALLWVLLLQCDIGGSQSKISVWLTVLYCTVACTLFLAAAGAISQWFDYRGLEISKILMLVGIYICVLGAIASAYGSRYKVAAIALASMLYLSHFVMYLSSYWGQDATQGLLIGSVLGLGICLSFCTLLYFTLTWFRANHAVSLVLALLAFHSASKIANAVDLAAQIDLLPSSETVFDVRGWLDEHGIVGRILKSLVGYEATPSLANLIAFLTSLFLVAVVMFWHVEKNTQGVLKELKHD
ncbi:iron transporter [Pseudoalteromonas sp. T1lg23B]|uniref:iron transporter n=1 Tax=Pseudoalteromonas sp. T1lg23B TaxID=2077097 RepID=UPI000CF60029|nr:iron transporter [Pseudoalteromonas sp. T1lg23B]